LLEREHDAKNRATRSSVAVGPFATRTTVMLFAGICFRGRLGLSACSLNLLTSIIGAVTLVSYLFIYTPLKRVTWTEHFVGAIPARYRRS